MPQGFSLTHRRQRAEVDYVAGLVAGLIGAAIVAVLVLIAEGLLLLRAVAQLALGTAAAHTNMGLALGLALYMGGCAVLGALFAVVHSATTSSESLWIGTAMGAAYGLLLWLVVFVALTPVLSRSMLSIPVPVQIGATVAFGIVLGFYPRLRSTRETG